MVSRNELVKVLRLLLNEGFRFTIIGGTVLELALGSKNLGDDIDLFAEKPDVLMEEEIYREIAERRGWVLGQTWLGTPRILVRLGDIEIPVEFYDNLYDFYVPEEMISRAQRINLGEVRVKILSLEDYIVLKANAGREKDLEKLEDIGKLIKRGRISIDKKKVLELTKLFDSPEVIVRRLKDSGVL